MKKLILLFVYILFFNNIFCQDLIQNIFENILISKTNKNQNKYIKKYKILNDSIEILRVPENKIYSSAKGSIIEVQNRLDKAYSNYLNKQEIETDITLMNINSIKSLDKSWNTIYYLNEIDAYKNFNKQHKLEIDSINKYQIQRKYEIQDSIKKDTEIKAKKRKDSLMVIKEKKEFEKDSLDHIKNPYNFLVRHLNGISKHYGGFSYFVGLDVNFVNIRFSTYLQTDMNLAYIYGNSNNNFSTTKYTPKITTEDEYINVNYYLKNINYIPFIQTDDSICSVITKCEVIGTKDLIIDIFLNYWSQNIKLGGYKQGEIAHMTIMGDRISLIGVSPNQYKILIEKGNATCDYYSTFKIY